MRWSYKSQNGIARRVPHMLGVNQVRVTFLLTVGYAMGPRRFARQLDMNARQLCLYCVRGESENGIVAENIRCDVFRLTINKFGFELAF